MNPSTVPKTNGPKFLNLRNMLPIIIAKIAPMTMVPKNLPRPPRVRNYSAAGFNPLRLPFLAAQ